MKRILCLMIAFTMALALCGAAMAEGLGGPLAGGWTPSESPEITEEIRAVFDRAVEGLLGVNYVPVAYLGSQVVAGTNHCILCQATAVVPGARPEYKLVYIYQDLEGGAQVLSVADLDFGALCEY